MFTCNSKQQVEQLEAVSVEDLSYCNFLYHDVIHAISTEACVVLRLLARGRFGKLVWQPIVTVTHLVALTVW